MQITVTRKSDTRELTVTVTSEEMTKQYRTFGRLDQDRQIQAMWIEGHRRIAFAPDNRLPYTAAEFKKDLDALLVVTP